MEQWWVSGGEALSPTKNSVPQKNCFSQTELGASKMSKTSKKNEKSTSVLIF